MTILESIRNYIALCPHLKTFNDILMLYIDFSKSDDSTTYSINEGIAQPISKKYIDGSSERIFLFTLSSVEAYGSDFEKNLENCGFYEDFSEWLETQTKIKNFPIMDTGKQVLKIEALSNGYLFSNSEDGINAIYQIQCKLTYYQNNN